MSRNIQQLHDALENQNAQKVDKYQTLFGVLGAIIDGSARVEVPPLRAS